MQKPCVLAENNTSFSLNPYLINTLSILSKTFLLRPVCLSNLNDVTLAVEDTNSLKASNVNVDEEYVDVDADAVNLLCLSDLNDMTLAVEADTNH